MQKKFARLFLRSAEKFFFVKNLIMSAIVSKGQDFILTIPKSLISEKEIQKILDLPAFYESVKNSTMTENKAWILSEEIKEEWWQKHKNQILAKIG